LIGAEGARLHYKTNLCDWSNISADRQRLVSSTKKDKANTSPFALIAISTSRDDQLRCAKLWVSKGYPASAQPIWTGEIYKHDKIRIGYVSGDFYLHAISQLTAGMFECHDRARFETTAISIGPDDKSELRNRLKDAFDYFLDVNSLSDDEIANQIRQKEIDILVNLTGFTQHARSRIFAYRPAPLQVNYLGFPATMGADYIDYMIADKTVVPESHRQHYSEKIIHLPNSYQANDSKRAISEKVFSREEMGLKDDSFVFCCFNNSFKILPETFDSWARILKQVHGSVLWLLETNATVAENLRKEARHRGLDSERLVFAPRISTPDHLARHRCADLFLDTLPYNAHTTASDALWAGLPVLTQIGETFAGRVAASLLTAIGLPELITPTPKDYEDLAIELATSPEKLLTIKRKLAENRLTTSLFNTQLFTQDIERAYVAIYDRYQRGLPPEHTDVAQSQPLLALNAARRL
jgi:predicted O-linked N-acetylglucosamine transferase (SPINDLY family)